MRYALVGVVLCVACGTNTAPIAPTARTIDRAMSVDTIPYATGVHLAALPLNYTYTLYPMAMNDWGEVVGTWVENAPNQVGPTIAFKWQGTSGVRTLSLPSGFQSQAVGVNDSGQVAITVDSSNGSEAAIWGWFGDVKYLRDLSTFSTATEHPNCQALAINDHGIVLGQCTLACSGVACAELPTLWTTFGTPYAFHPGGGSGVLSAFAAHILTDSGYAAGSLESATQPFVFNTATKTLRTISVAGTAHAVNDLGDAVGELEVNQPGCQTHAVIWPAGGTMQDLGICGYATGISDDGIVIGNFETTDSAFAFVWTAGTGVQRLPHLYPANGSSPGAPLPAELSTAITINRQHQILGVAFASGLPTEPPTQTAVLWTLPATFGASPISVARR